jgi:hypothetical protein
MSAGSDLCNSEMPKGGEATEDLFAASNQMESRSKRLKVVCFM